MDWEFGISRCKLLRTGWIKNKGLLHCTENCSQCPVKTMIEKNMKKNIQKMCQSRMSEVPGPPTHFWWRTQLALKNIERTPDSVWVGFTLPATNSRAGPPRAVVLEDADMGRVLQRHKTGWDFPFTLSSQFILIFNWKITALQYCVSFCHTSKHESAIGIHMSLKDLQRKNIIQPSFMVSSNSTGFQKIFPKSEFAPCLSWDNPFHINVSWTEMPLIYEPSL